MGLNDSTIKTIIAKTNVLLQHYGTNYALGVTLQATLENLQLKLGVQGCPLEYNFEG